MTPTPPNRRDSILPAVLALVVCLAVVICSIVSAVLAR